MEGKPLSKKNAEQCMWLFVLDGRRGGQSYRSKLIRELGLIVWLDGQGPGQNTSRELAARRSGKKYVDGSLQTDTEHKDICGVGEHIYVTSPATFV